MYLFCAEETLTEEEINKTKDTKREMNVRHAPPTHA